MLSKVHFGAENRHFSILKPVTQVLHVKFAGGAIFSRAFLVDPSGFRA